ncbi:MAG: LuxR C-terminal-related transcriptional regulator [Treponema sp.]|jgi:LuxR family maltose regulon positive regulatory protein|nr:LuxR C-terminal-related transcriptional regulator [Treponema sp.]
MAKKTVKNTMPQDHLFLERPRVDQILERAFQSHVVTVVAGEGNGKTCAVYSFLQKDPRKIIWVQLSERDNLGWRFWENYTGEVAHLNRDAAKVLAGMGFPESRQQFERYFTLLRSDIISPARYVIVFDDFHLLTSPRVLRHLERALAPPFSKNTIVFISRTEPALNTLSLLAKGLLSQITVEDLRFNEEEIGEYARLCEIPLEGEAVSRIAQETEGWALAVDLMLQEMKAGTGDREKPVWDLMLNPIRKIEEDMFNSMGGGLRKFLIKLSLIEHWPLTLLERLDPEGKNIAAMENFSALIRFDAYLHGFRIHHLFLDFLREKQHTLSVEEKWEVYAIGAQWSIENNMVMDAAINYERAGDYGGLVRIINSLPALLSRTVAAFFLDILNRMIPAEQRPGEPEDLLFVRYVIRPRLLMLLGRYQESAGEYERGIRHIEALPPGLWRSGSLSRVCCSMGILKILSCRYTGDYDFAPWFERSYHYYLENPEGLRDQTLSSNLNSYMLQVGDPAAPEEVEVFVQALTLAVPFAANALNGFLFGTDTLVRAELAYYQGDLNQAEQFARQSVYQGREQKQYEVENRGLFFLIRIAVHTGNFAEIRRLQRQLEAQLEIPGYLNRHAIYDIMMGRFYSRIGLIEKIAPWLRAEVDEGEFNGLFRSFDILIKARCFFFEKNYAAVLQILGEKKHRDDMESFILGKLEILALETAARFRLGEEAAALEALETAYLTAAPSRLDMPFIEMGEDMRLLAGAGRASDKIPRPWLENIRSRASAYGKQAVLAAEYCRAGDAEPKPTAYLTRQERAVLSGLSRGLKREDIAAETGISLNNVKTTISAVYGKLGALNRADAIRIAGTWGIV